MPRCEIRYRDSKIRDLIRAHADEITEAIAAATTTTDRTGTVDPSYVKLELTHAPDDINVRDISISLSARALPGRMGREREIARATRAAFVAATGGHYSVGVWVVLSEHSTYREYTPE